MAGAGLGGYFASDPNPNPFVDILPHGGAVLNDMGQPEIDEATPYQGSDDEEGWDPPTGNGLLGKPSIPNGYNHLRDGGDEEYLRGQGIVVADLKRRYSGASKLDQLKYVEEQIRDLLLERRKLLSELKAERDEINERLSVSEKVSEVLDEMFPDTVEDEPEFESESE